MCIRDSFWDGQYGLVSFLFAVLLLTVSPVPYGVGADGCNASELMYACVWNFMPVEMHELRITWAKELPDFRI